MSKKITNTQLAVVLIALLAIYGISRYISNRKGENTFHANIIPKIDTNKVTSVFIYSKAKKGHPIQLEKQGEDWYVSQDDIRSRAEQNAPKYIIKQLMAIDPDRLATNDVKQWHDYVVDTTGTRIVLMEGKDTMIDVIVGKFGFMPEQRQGISYVRVNHHNEVYGVPGFLAMNITQDFDSWRDRKLVSFNYPTWTKLTYTYPADSGYSVKKDTAGNWRFDDGSLADAQAALDNMTATAQQNYGSFVNKFDTNAQAPMFILTIEGKDSSPVILKAYPADTANKYIITSSIAPGSYMSGAKSSLFDKIFLSKKAYLHHEEPKKPGAPAKAIAKGPAGKAGKK